MVIGHGLLGTAFAHYCENEQVLLFCSGVSNSICQSEIEFNRERNLLLSMLTLHAEKRFVYFSTCSVYDPSLMHQPYVNHKKAMEDLIIKNHSNYLILRVSNLAGRTDNPYTILNFFYKAIETGIEFELWEQAERNIIGINEIVDVVNYIFRESLFTNSILNVANPQSYKVTYLVEKIERYLGKSGHYHKVNKGLPFSIPLQEIQSVYEKIGLKFGDDYFQNILLTYYPL